MWSISFICAIIGFIVGTFVGIFISALCANMKVEDCQIKNAALKQEMYKMNLRTDLSKQ